MSKRTCLILFGLALCIILLCVFFARSNTAPGVLDADATFKEDFSDYNASTIGVPDVDSVPVSMEASENDSERNAEENISDYNALAIEYNKAATIYNGSIDLVIAANNVFNSKIFKAQTLLDSGSVPYEIQTKVALEQAIESAKEAIVSVPSVLSLREIIEIPDSATDDEIRNYREMALSGIKYLTNTEVPTPLEVPDYTVESETIQIATEAFNQSVLVQLQITAPSDNFVLQRIKEIDSVLSASAVTKSNDPNELLGTVGGYIGCIYFSDINVDKTRLGLKPNEYDVITMGTVGGGAVEIYNSINDAETRNMYLAQYDGTSLDPGSHVVLGTMVVRASSKLTESQRENLVNLIITVLTRVD